MNKEIRFIAPRTAIRNQVVTILTSALPVWDSRFQGEDGEDRICASRVAPLAPHRLPTVLIYTRDERLDEDPHADPGLRHRVLEIAVEVVAAGAEADDTVDILCCAVETILDNNETLGGLVEGTRLSRVETDMDGDGETVFVASRMTFEVRYWTVPVHLPEMEPGIPEIAPAIRGGLPSYSGRVPDSCPWMKTGDCDWRRAGRCDWGWPCVPAYPVMGLTPDIGGEEDAPAGTIAVPDKDTLQRLRVMVSMSPFVGIPYRACYRPLEEGHEPPHPHG